VEKGRWKGPTNEGYAGDGGGASKKWKPIGIKALLEWRELEEEGKGRRMWTEAGVGAGEWKGIRG